MIGLLVQLVILLLVLGIVWWIARLIVTGLGLPPLVLTLVQVLLALIVLIWILGILGMIPGPGPGPSPGRGWWWR